IITWTTLYVAAEFYLYLLFTSLYLCCFFFFNDTATTEIYTLSLHDALPICFTQWVKAFPKTMLRLTNGIALLPLRSGKMQGKREDRKSTRLNSSHVAISYAVFCLKKKKSTTIHIAIRSYYLPVTLSRLISNS